MYFEIQVCDPSFTYMPNTEREDLSSAIRAIFPANTEDAILIWNWIPIRVNYNADLSVMMEDLLILLNDLLNHVHGERLARFGANTFRTDWSVSWADGKVRIDATWHSVAGSYLDLLNSRRLLEIDQQEFLSEWKALLRKVIFAVEKNGVVLVNNEDLVSIRRVEAAIRDLGRLYRTKAL